MRKILWFPAFFALVFAGDRLGGWFLQKQVDDSQFRYSRMYRGEAGAEILLVGNSRGLTFFQPYIEQVTGKTTFNLSYNGLPADAAKVLVQDYLERYPAPQCMLVDITTCDRVNDELLTGFLTYTAHSQRLDTLIHGKQPKMWWGSQVSWLTRFNNEVFQRSQLHRSKSDEDWMLDRVISERLVAEVAQNQYPLEVHPYLVLQLKEIVAAARAKGVAVKLVISPYLPGFTVTNLDALKTAVEQATGLPVHDYRAALADVTLFGDFMHPNKKGSLQYIDLLKRDSVLP
ncbi:MAG: hypothetical protein ACK4Q5_15030 [Saprospiraceae bacterium]